MLGERFNAIDFPSLGIIGCMKSHLAVLKIAKERNYKNILILEDDFTFTVSKEEFNKNLTLFFSLHKEFDVFMLSFAHLQYDETDNENIFKVLSSQTASGYLVNQSYYDKLIRLFEWADPLLEETKQHWIYANDQIWKSLQKPDKWYCFCKRLGKQRPGYSDTGETSRYVSYDC